MQMKLIPNVNSHNYIDIRYINLSEKLIYNIAIFQIEKYPKFQIFGIKLS